MDSKKRFPSDFESLLERCKEKGFDDDFIIGSGNPDSEILFIGREPSGDAHKTNTLKHYIDICDGVLPKDAWTRKKSEECKPNMEIPNYWLYGKTLWAQYQKLCDIIFDEHQKDRKEIIDFEEHVFCSEMNGSPSPRTGQANKESIPFRKENFFTDSFFDRFPVVLLACGNYIQNHSQIPEEREIDSIFHVSFSSERVYGTRNKMWVHYNEDHTRLVIHTRNLCSDVSTALIEGIGTEIRSFLQQLHK